MKIEEGEICVDPVTYQPLLPITIYIPIEATADLHSMYALDIADTLSLIIGNEIVSHLRARKTY